MLRRQRWRKARKESEEGIPAREERKEGRGWEK